MADTEIYTSEFLTDLFINPEKGNYTLKDDASVFENNKKFKTIPFDQIGRNKTAE
ncbi:MAG: hypothetical protein MJ132_07335 [Clostridia bacterium]|nr:hypothetical protein [Clostridia bacterium]